MGFIRIIVIQYSHRFGGDTLLHVAKERKLIILFTFFTPIQTIGKKNPFAIRTSSPVIISVTMQAKCAMAMPIAQMALMSMIVPRHLRYILERKRERTRILVLFF